MARARKFKLVAGLRGLRVLALRIQRVNTVTVTRLVRVSGARQSVLRRQAGVFDSECSEMFVKITQKRKLRPASGYVCWSEFSGFMCTLLDSLLQLCSTIVYHRATICLNGAVCRNHDIFESD